MTRGSIGRLASQGLVVLAAIAGSTIVLAQSGPSVETACPASDAEGAAEAQCEYLIGNEAWVPLTSEEGWNWCVPPSTLFETGAPEGGWSPESFCDLYATSMCSGGGPLLMLCPECFPPSLNGPGGCASALMAWMLSSLRENSVPSTGDPPDRCGGFQKTINDAAEFVDLEALATSLGTTESQILVDVAVMWLGEHGSAWASEEEGSLCGVPLECIMAGIGAAPGGGQQFSLSADQFAMLDAASGGALSGCDLCSDPGGGSPKRWGSLFGDQNGDGQSLDCLDLIQLLDTSGQCYPPPGEPGEMSREDVIDLAGEFMSQEGADCPKLSECLATWMSERMPNVPPLSAGEMIELAVDACGNTFEQFPPDMIEDPSGVAYEDVLAGRAAEEQWQFPPDYIETDGPAAEARWEAWGFDVRSLRSSSDACGESECPLPGDSGSGPRGTGDTNPYDLSKQFPGQWIAPVDLRYGSKLEYELDMAIPITGGHYSFSRTYRSGSDWTPSPLLGEGWTATSFARLLISEDSVRLGSNSGLQTTAPIPTDSGALAVVGDPPVQLVGPTHRTIQASQLCIDGSLVPVYRVSEPGRWVMDYYRPRRGEGEGIEAPLVGCGSVIDPDAALVGLPLQRRDPYGNTQTYEYGIFPTGESSSVARLERIVLARRGDGNSDPGGVEAEIRFQWIIDPSKPGIVGRLRQVTALRWNGDGVATAIAKTSYLYFDDIPEANVDLGTDGDLVQVTRSVRVDPAPGETGTAPVWHRRVTQYRYHGGEGAWTWIQGQGGVEFNWDGAPHQLKMIIGPSQIEAVAAKLAAGSPSTRLDVAAASLLELADGANAIGSSGSPKVVDLASKIVEKYDETTEAVLYEYVQGGCGCGSGGSGAVHSKRYAFEYWSHGEPADQWTARVVEEAFDADYSQWQPNKTTYIDMAAVGPDLDGTDEKPALIVQRAVVLDDEASTPPMWVTAVEYWPETGLPKKVYPPSNEPTYTRATSTTAAEFTPGTAGFVREYAYNGDKRPTEEWISNVAGETSYILTRRTWGDGTGDTRTYLLDSIEYFRTPLESVGSLDDDDVERTDFQYRFHPDSDGIAVMEVETEWDGPAFNGPEVGEAPAFVYTHEFFDRCGRNVWSRAPDGSITRREFAPGIGRSIVIERNAEPPGSWPVATTGLNGDFEGRNESGGSLTSTATYDPLGRTRSITSAAGVTTRLRRELRTCYDHPGIEYLAIVALPPEVGEASHAGPASILWVDGAGATIAAWDCAVTSSYSADGDSETWPTDVTSYTVAAQPHLALARAKATRSMNGQIKSTTVWHDPAGGGPDGGSATTHYRFDALGRLSVVVNPVGTVTQTVYDPFGRVRKVGVGVLDGSGEPANVTTIVRNVYDGGGVGNGNLTWSVAKIEAEAISAGSETESGGDRITEYHHDWRDRVILVEGPTAPFTAVEYDNLDRVVRMADYSSAPSVPFDLGADSSDRLSLRRTTYSQRGLVVKDELALDPTSEASSAQEFIGSYYWHDESGRVVGAWAPGSPGRKTTFDGLGRPTTVYITDRGSDAAPGIGSHEHVHALVDHASNTDSDHVLEQIEYGYVPGTADDRRGLLQSVVRRQRLHDASSGVEDLGWSNSIATFKGIYYDTAARPFATADYGTNDSSGRFITVTSGDAPSIDQDSVPASSDTVLVTLAEFDERGLVGTTTDPMGRTTRFVRDALGRVIATIENAETAVTIAWDPGADNWGVTGASTSADVNRVTSFVFDRAGNLRKQTAHRASSTDDQVTEYFFGVDEDPNGPGGAYGQSVQSTVFSNDLPKRVTYPEGSGGGDTPARSVYLGWNRQAELIGSVDQNNTLHELTRDAAGRVIADKGTKGSGSTIDDAMDLVEYEFDTAGRLKKVTGLKDGGTPTVRNQVELRYTALGQVSRIYQHQKGAVSYDGSGVPTGDTRLVGYAYADAKMASGNFSRLVGLDYPRHANSSGVDPQTMDYDYGSTGSIDDLISRPVALKINMSTTSGQKPFAIYTYLGLNTPVVVDFGGDSTPDIQLDRTASLDGKRNWGTYTENAGIYPAFDQFGRLKLQIWADGAMTTAGSPAYPTKPQIVALEYGHDRNGNRTSAFDVRRQNAWPMSHEYTNDKLDRLTKARRNTWANLTGGSANAPGTQAWTLDPLGNWADVSTWTSGSTPTPEDRAHNKVNEVLTRDIPGTSADHTLGFDNAGNLATVAVTGGSTTTYTHDLWNRLVKVTVGSTVKFEQEFNGLNWRTLKREDTGGSAGLDEERAFTYSANWQLLEERVDSNYTGSPGLDKRVQHFWGLRHIDDCVIHRADENNDGDYQDSYEGRWFHLTDGQFSTVAIVNHAGTLVERVTYDSYGKARHHQPNDVDGDGDCDSSDKGRVDAIRVYSPFGSIPISSGYYRAEADLNRDGFVNATDSTLAGNYASALSAGQISSASRGGPDNCVGWCGYIFNRATGQYLVRFRTFDTGLGRWVERDPIGFVDGMSLYEYVRGAPHLAVDPSGLVWHIVGGAVVGGVVGGAIAWWNGDDIVAGAIEGAVVGAVVASGAGLVIAAGEAGGVVAGMAVAGAIGAAGGAAGSFAGQTYAITTNHQARENGGAYDWGRLGNAAMGGAVGGAGGYALGRAATAVWSKIFGRCGSGGAGTGSGATQGAASAVRSTSSSHLDALSRAAGAPSTKPGLTAAGHAFTKHAAAQRARSSAFPRLSGGPAEINRRAQEIVDDILTAPGTSVVRRYRGRFGSVEEHIAPDGRGIVYGPDGRLLFFREGAP